MTFRRVEEDPLEIAGLVLESHWGGSNIWSYRHDVCGYHFRCVDKPINVETFRCPHCAVLR